jgi:cobalt-zinc-cadmium efflux system outer membrane protein
MALRRLLSLSGLLLLGGCLYNAREKTDAVVADLASHPVDLAPPSQVTAPAPPAQPATDRAPRGRSAALPAAATDVQTAALIQPGPGDLSPEQTRARLYDLKIPPELPGAEAPPLAPLPKDRAQREALVRRLYPPLEPLPEEPTALPSPNGRPLTLADLQQLAAVNSPTLRQAASDVEAARGNLIQAAAYPNPTVGYEADANNNNSATGAQGVFVDQPIKTFGKLKLQTAAAQKDLDNAELALRRARSDLSTQVRTAYFGLLVARETMRVTRGLARFTDEVYRLHTGLLQAGTAASYEPAALRGQAFTARLAYKQAISGYVYAWKQLVTAVGLHQMPLTEVAGRIDVAVPYYDYDAVLAHVLRNHTDVRTAANGLEKARFNLKFAQITPWPDLDVRVAYIKEYTLPPFAQFHTVQVGLPLPVWDQNRGNVIAAEGALVRASEESHRVELNLTNTLATAYLAYKNNLDALEYYRRHILPDQVLAYRGVFERRRIDPSSPFGDLVAAQQALATSVTSYLTILGQLWTSVVNVADLLQTDDLFQLGTPRKLPELPDLDHLSGWECPHGAPPSGPAGACPPGPPAALGQPVPALPGTPLPTTGVREPVLPAPRPVHRRGEGRGTGGEG